MIPEPEPEIERCVCGRGAHLFQGPNDSRCACEVAECWKGPVCATPTAAITAWNTLMRAARERDAAINERNEERMAWHNAIRAAELGDGWNLTYPGRPIEAKSYIEQIVRRSKYPFAMAVGDFEVQRVKTNIALADAARERARLQAEVAAAHETIVGEWGGVETQSGEYSGARAFAWCTCPDCTEHRARGKETNK